MATGTVLPVHRKIQEEGWLEHQSYSHIDGVHWTRQWVVATHTAVYVYDNYKCYKNAKQIIHGTDMLSAEPLDGGIGGQNLLCIKTNKETVYFKCIGYSEQNGWKHSLNVCKNSIKIPISVQCATTTNYNSNFELTVPYYVGYSFHEIIKDIIAYLHSIYIPIKFAPKTIHSKSFCRKKIDFTAHDWNDWKCRDKLYHGLKTTDFSKNNVIKNGIKLEVDIDTKQQQTKTAQVKKMEKKTSENEEEKKKKNEMKKWLVENEHNELLWDRLKNSDRRERYKFQQLRMESMDSKHLSITLQTQYIKENEIRIKELLQKVNCNTHLADKLVKILNDCALIRVTGVHEEILRMIVNFVTVNGLMPIYYTLPYLPLFHPITLNGDGRDAKKLYYNTLKIWWNEVRVSRNHWGAFQPKHIESAAVEFTQFLTKRLTENGDMLKYYLVPHMTMDKTYNIWNSQEMLSFRLGNRHCKCVGGVELFQRLYLEAAVEGFFGLGHCFVADLQHIVESHGDNWCFDGNGYVLMADNSYKKVCNLVVGDMVRSFPNFVSRIVCCITSNINDRIEMVELKNNCWITFEHPVLIKDGDCRIIDGYDGLNTLDADEIKKYNLLWVLPKQISLIQLRYQDKIYNFMLDSHHTINVNGNWCCTLGHDYKGEIIYHPFWGNSAALKSFLKSKCETYPHVVF